MVSLWYVAWEVLGIPSKRRSYDSVDPQFDDTIPSAGPEAKESFIEVFGPVFERNARLDIRWGVMELQVVQQITNTV